MEKIKRNILSLFKESEFEKAMFKAMYNDKQSIPKEKHI